MNMGHQNEIQSGLRYEFGANWSRFVGHMTQTRIESAKASLKNMLGELQGKNFLDVGSGSGLFSLAASQLGAKVISFDYDPMSVATTQYLKENYAPAADWMILQGSVLDSDFLNTLSQSDIVYSWGVLHHTGSMWQAISNAAEKVKPGGKFFLAIYNDQGWLSKFWLGVKKIYCSGLLGKFLMSLIFVPVFALGGFVRDILRLKNPLRRYLVARDHRGMSPWHDWHDWLGGLPFEVTSPAELESFMKKVGFEMGSTILVGNKSGCNEFVFIKSV